MTRKPTKSAPRIRPVLGAVALALVAALVLTGPASAHHHGREHHKRHHHRHKFDSQRGPTGTIASYDKDTGKLVIGLAGGDTVRGLVNDETWIEFSHSCDHHGWSGWDHRRRQLHDWNWGGSEASTDDLVPGASVDDAVLVIADGKATFVKIDLTPPPAPGPQPQS